MIYAQMRSVASGREMSINTLPTLPLSRAGGRSEGASRMIRGLMLRMKRILFFLLFSKYLRRYSCIMKSTGSVVNYCLSNAIHGIGQSMKSLEVRVCTNEYLSLSIATAVFV